MYQATETEGAIVFLVSMFWYAAVSVGLAIPLVIRYQSVLFPTESAALAAADATLDREAEALTRLVYIGEEIRRSKGAPDAIALRVKAIDHEIAAQLKRFRDAQHRRASLDPRSAAEANSSAANSQSDQGAGASEDAESNEITGRQPTDHHPNPG